MELSNGNLYTFIRQLSSAAQLVRALQRKIRFDSRQEPHIVVFFAAFLG
jgi:hypothetical protein